MKDWLKPIESVKPAPRVKGEKIKKIHPDDDNYWVVPIEVLETMPVKLLAAEVNKLQGHILKIAAELGLSLIHI